VRPVSSPAIYEFLFDDENIAKFGARGIAEDAVDSILDGEFVTLPNRKERRGAYLVIGRDYSGRCLAIPVEPTHDPAVWRPITAWPCKPSEAAHL
jgi:hypothetical protein